jgi:hypothetical protein
MCETVRREFGEGGSIFAGRLNAQGAWDLDLATALAALRATTAEAGPWAVLGTAFNFVQLLDHLAAQGCRLLLPPGSRVMETGGYKGRTRALSRAELHARITERLGVPARCIVCEYGMSELSAQAYDCQVSASSGGQVQGAKFEVPSRPRVFRFPPWARVQVISPKTGREVAEGETGLLRVFDLANVWSAMAVQTEDLGVRRGDGFELIGRAARAEPRGCSLRTG